MNKECVHILLLNKRMLNLAIVFKLTTAFTSSKHFAVNFEYQLIDSTRTKVAHLDLSINHHP